MQDDNVQLEDLLSHPGFKKWVLEGDASAEEYWRTWMEVHPQHRDMVLQARALLLKMQFSYEEPKDEEKEALLAKILQHDRTSLRETKPRRQWLGTFVRIAAIFIVGAGVWGIYQWRTTPPGEISLVTRSNPPGQRAQFRLPDGSKVWLSVASQLTFPAKFSGDERWVELEGEAFFDVRHDTLRPFKVRSATLETTVLGTSFNVSSYPGQLLHAVSLVSGKVEVGYPGATAATLAVLAPQQQLEWDAERETVQVSSFDQNKVLAWRSGTLAFEDADFLKVVSLLERWYGVSINYSKEPSVPWNVYGKFENESLKYVLDILALSKDFEYSMEDDQVFIDIP